MAQWQSRCGRQERGKGQERWVNMGAEPPYPPHYYNGMARCKADAAGMSAAKVKGDG